MAQWQEEWGEEMKWRQTTGTVCIDPQQWERTAWWEMWWVDFRPLWHFYIKVFEWVFGLTSFMHQAGEESSHSNLPTGSLVWLHPWITAEISMRVVFYDPRSVWGMSSHFSLHLCLQQGTGHQLYLWRVAAVDGTQGVGSQVGQQQFRAPVQQVEHVFC